MFGTVGSYLHPMSTIVHISKTMYTKARNWIIKQQDRIKNDVYIPCLNQTVNTRKGDL